MIKNPKPFIWTACKNFDKISRTCLFSPYILPCATDRSQCHNCYLYQKHASDNRLKRDGEVVERVCDRCGQHIGGNDIATWVRLRSRDDRTIIEKELCLACAGELIEWLENKEEGK